MKRFPKAPSCPRCGSDYIVDGKCRSMDSECEDVLALEAQLAEERRVRGILAEALGYALWQHNGGGSPASNHWSVKATNALAALRLAMDALGEANCSCRHPFTRGCCDTKDNINAAIIACRAELEEE